jgi:DNA polymerase-1
MTTVLIDGHHMMYRCCFIPELQRLKTRRGIPTGPVFGFLRVLGATLKRLKATSCVVVWDVGRSAYRQEFYPAYKANRDDKDKPEALGDLPEQIEITQEILPHLNVKQLAIQGYEGDDLLYLLIKTLREMGGFEVLNDIVVVTEDKDLLQLVHRDTKVYRPISDQLIDVDNFEEMTGTRRDYFVLRKALVGDKSDNIDGVRGVGEKTANKLITEAYCREDGWMCDLGGESLRTICADHKTKTARRVSEQWDIVERNVKLVDLTKFPFTKRDSRKARGVLNSNPGALTPAMGLMKILGKYEFNKLLDGFVHWVRPFRRLA